MLGITQLLKHLIRFICLLFLPVLSQAATVAIDSLSITQLDLAISVPLTGDNFTFSTTVEPPADIQMGTYQDPIYTITDGADSFTAYSTGIDGFAAPSGTVDTSATSNNIFVDFSSLRGNLVLGSPGPLMPATLDFELWPLNTQLDSGNYNALDDSFTLTWTEQVIVNGITLGLDVSLGGDVSLVPLPAAIWLFGSGLMGLVYAGRRRRLAQLV